MCSTRLGSTGVGDLYEILCVSAIVGWVLSRPLRWFLGAQMGAIGGLGLALILSGVGLIWPASNWPVAIFSPVSLGIAALALADLGRAFGVRARRWSLAEMAGVLGLYVGYVFASVGGIAFDPYALGYNAGVSLGVPVLLAGYAYRRKDWLMGAVVAGAQVLWMANIGSENLFDHLAGALLIPAALIGMARRLRLG